MCVRPAVGASGLVWAARVCTGYARRNHTRVSALGTCDAASAPPPLAVGAPCARGGRSVTRQRPAPAGAQRLPAGLPPVGGMHSGGGAAMVPA